MTFYDVVYATGIGITAPIWLLFPKLRRKVLDALRERDGTMATADPASGPVVLIHAVSMGEINATTALVRLLSDTVSEIQFLISTTSRTGEAQARKLYAADPKVTLIRYPFDFSKSVGKMLDARRPRLAVLMELEVWPNFMLLCAQRKIPVVLINGRLSAYSYRGYRLAGPLIKPMFRRLSIAAVQEEAYARRFQRVGVPADRIRVTGTMKFDTAQLADPIAEANALAQVLGLRRPEEKVWVCGSTGPGEERIILTAYTELRKSFPTLRLLIVPRHPERFSEVAAQILAAGFEVLRRSIPRPPDAPPAPIDPPTVILGDTMGELRKFYSLADIVFVGRTLVDLGSKQHGSDMIEPAALAKPIMIGPHTGNFAEVMNRFREDNALCEVADGPALTAAVSDLLLAPIHAAEMATRAQDVVRKNLGATARHAEIIIEHLKLAR